MIGLEHVPQDDAESKPVLVEGKDFVILVEGSTEVVEKFLGVKLENATPGIYSFPNDGKSRRTYPGDRLMFEGDKVLIWPPKQFKDQYEVKK